MLVKNFESFFYESLNKFINNIFFSSQNNSSLQHNQAQIFIHSIFLLFAAFSCNLSSSENKNKFPRGILIKRQKFCPLGINTIALRYAQPKAKTCERVPGNHEQGGREKAYKNFSRSFFLPRGWTNSMIHLRPKSLHIYTFP